MLDRRPRHNARAPRRKPVELGLVQVGRDDAFLEIVEHDIADDTAEIPKSLFVELCPGLLARLPDHPPEAAPRVAQRHHKQARSAVATALWITGQRAFAIIDLRFLARGKLETVKLFGIDVAQGAHKTLDALVAGSEAELVNEILVDRLRIPFQTGLLFDPFPMRFTG